MGVQSRGRTDFFMNGTEFFTDGTESFTNGTEYFRNGTELFINSSFFKNGTEIVYGRTLEHHLAYIRVHLSAIFVGLDG